MTKQASSPPTRDTGTPTAPPPPPGWRHYLWVVAVGAFILLYFVVPATKSQNPGDAQLFAIPTRCVGTQSKDSHDCDYRSANWHVVERRTTTRQRSATSLLSILPRAITEVRTSNHRVNDGGTSFGSEVLSWLDIAPALHCSRLLAVATFQGGIWPVTGALGVGRSKAKVFDEESPKTTFADVAGYEGAKL